MYCRGNNNEREMLGRELEEYRKKWSENWKLEGEEGDFNITLRSEERNGRNVILSDAIV